MKPTTKSTRRRATAAIIREYLRDTLDWARENGTARSNNVGMGAGDLLAKIDGQEEGATGLAEAFGYTGPLNEKQGERDSFARDVLLAAQSTLDDFGADADASEVASGIAAAGRLVKSAERADHSGLIVHVMKVTLGIFTDDIDGREHNHSLAPREWDPPRGWDCCLDLPGQRPTRSRLHDARFGDEAPMTLVKLPRSARLGCGAKG